jgi:DNA-binding MarR family transcriptional regulator
VDELGAPPLGYLLYRAMATLRPATANELRALNLTLPQYICLRILSLTPGRSNAELARDMNVTPQATHIVLLGLQDAGVVTRPISAPSGRALPAQLTTQGIARLICAEAVVRVAEHRVLVGLNTDEERELNRLLAKLIST